MAPPHERNDGGPPAGDRASPDRAWTPTGGRRGDRGRPRGRRAVAEGGWIWGWHAGAAALANAGRDPPTRLVATPERARELSRRLGPAAVEGVQALSAGEIGALLPPGAAHQGLAILGPPLEARPLETLAASREGVLVMLDQVTDPHNVGAVFRSAAAFGARGVVLQDRHAPALTGALAKAAAGAIEVVPHARVVNLARALDSLADLGWRAVGLAAEAELALPEALDARATVLVLGSEGEGLRRLVAEHCDALARIPMTGGFESLNVSAAAAVALYEATRSRA